MVKQRKDAASQFIDANRQDLADVELAEIKVLENFLPQPLSEEELGALIDQAIADTQAQGMQDMGKVMGWLKPKVQGRADMGKLSGSIGATTACVNTVDESREPPTIGAAYLFLKELKHAMAGRIPRDFIDDLIARADIVEVVNSRVQLKKLGETTKPVAPFIMKNAVIFRKSGKQFYHCLVWCSRQRDLVSNGAIG